MRQKYFDYNLQPQLNLMNYYVSNANRDAYDYVINENEFVNNSIIHGPVKSGKTHLGLIWQNKNNAIIYCENDFNKIIKEKRNVFIDDFFEKLNEEYLFYIINHCYNNNLKILLSTDKYLSNYKFELSDLSSRLKSFNFIEIKQPDDELIVNLIIKLLFDKQIIVQNLEIFSYILKRINRTYQDIYLFVENVDKLSLEKKRELTIPLIKELL